MVVIGTENYREEIYRILSEEMHPEIGCGKISPEKALDRINLCLTSGIVFLARVDGEIAATVGLFPTAFWYSEEEHLTDAWFYIRRKYRKCRVVFRLMQAIKSLPGPVYLGIGSPIEIDRKERLFSRFGQRVGALYKVT